MTYEKIYIGMKLMKRICIINSERNAHPLHKNYYLLLNLITDEKLNCSIWPHYIDVMMLYDVCLIDVLRVLLHVH